MSSVQQDVFAIIAKQAKLDLSVVRSDATLKDLGVESLDAIEVIFDIEEQFNINLANEDTNFDTDTVGHLVEAVEGQLALQKPNG